jgi:hypothetical protein
VLRFPSLLLSQACLSLLQFAWAALNFHSLSGQQGVQRNQGDPVRELGNCQVAPVLKLHRLCGKSSAESYEPFRYKCSCLVSLSLDSLESWAFAHFFYCILLLCCPKALEPGMSMSTLPVWRAFVPLLSLFSWQKLTKDCTILCGPEGQQVAYAQTDIVCSNFKG